MQMNLEIDNNFFPHFKAMIDSFIKDNKVFVLEVDDYDYTKNAPASVIISSVEEVRRRVSLAEDRIKETGGLNEEVFWEAVEDHLDTL
jgi:hypothetical protein